MTRGPGCGRLAVRVGSSVLRLLAALCSRVSGNAVPFDQPTRARLLRGGVLCLGPTARWRQSTFWTQGCPTPRGPEPPRGPAEAQKSASSLSPAHPFVGEAGRAARVCRHRALSPQIGPSSDSHTVSLAPSHPCPHDTTPWRPRPDRSMSSACRCRAVPGPPGAKRQAPQPENQQRHRGQQRWGRTRVRGARRQGSRARAETQHQSQGRYVGLSPAGAGRGERAGHSWGPVCAWASAETAPHLGGVCGCCAHLMRRKLRLGADLSEAEL